MKIDRLSTLDQAQALSDCFYATYGLTFHRKYVYEPERLLELNQAGHITSFIATRHGEVVGHLGSFQPFYEVQRDGQTITDPSIREVGLSVVRPPARNLGVQAALGHAMYRWARGEGISGAYMKCVTHHTFSQRTAFASGGTPVALFLGGVPRWVVYDANRDQPNQPISTAVIYVPIRRGIERPLALTARRSWLVPHIKATRQARVDGAAVAWNGPTDLEVTWQGDRRIATVPTLATGTEKEVLASAQGRSLSQWALDQAGLPGRFAAARLEAIQLVAPKAQPVTLPKATLHTEAEVQTWLDAVRAAILARLADGPVVV